MNRARTIGAAHFLSVMAGLAACLPGLALAQAASATPDASAPASAVVTPAPPRQPRFGLWEHVTLKDGDPVPPDPLNLFGGRLRPILLFRGLLVQTFEDRYTVPQGNGKPDLVLDSSKMDPSQFGHRRGFVLDSVEVGLQGRFDSGFHYLARAEMIPREKDGNRSSDYLKDAYFGWNRYAWLDVRVGRMKVPFSQENLKPTAKQALIYSPVVDVLTSKRQVGLLVSGGDPWEVARLSAGVFNSTGLAVEQMKVFSQMLYVARLDLRIDRLLKALKVRAGDLEVNLGTNVAWVKQNYDPPTEHRWVGVDAHVHFWRFTTEAEFVLKDFFDPAAAGGVRKADRGWGWYTDLTFQAWPGVIDVTGRVEEMDGDRVVRGSGSGLSIDEMALQKKRWITAGVSLYLSRQARLDIDYVHRTALEGYNFKNDVVMGMFQFDL